jgi:hypothetical protein
VAKKRKKEIVMMALHSPAASGERGEAPHNNPDRLLLVAWAIITIAFLPS